MSSKDKKPPEKTTIELDPELIYVARETVDSSRLKIREIKGSEQEHSGT